jgi:hypothetical protein
MSKITVRDFENLAVGCSVSLLLMIVSMESAKRKKK